MMKPQKIKGKILAHPGRKYTSPTTQQYERCTEDRNTGWAGARQGDCGKGRGGRRREAADSSQIHVIKQW